ASGLAFAVAVNVGLLLMLLTLGRLAPDAKKISHALVVDLLPESNSAAEVPEKSEPVRQAAAHRETKPPPIVLPAKPTIAVPPSSQAKPSPLLEMSSADLAAADLRNLPKGGSGSAGDSEVLGTGPHGETLYAAEWARHPTDAELSGYLPPDAP